MSGKIRLKCLLFGVAVDLNYTASLGKKCFLLISYKLLVFFAKH